jgi:hypothetical protein
MTLEIVDSRGRSSYRIEPLSRDEARVSIRVGEELNATQTLEITPADYRELVGFLDEIAREWKGWSEQKVWRLQDERTSLEASHDGLGHVMLTARLLPRLYDLDWSAQATITLEAGQLDAVVERVRSAVDAI